MLALAVATAPARGQQDDLKAAPAKLGNENLGRFVPRENLLAYVEFDGLDAHARAWRASAAYKLLNDTKLGALVENLVLQTIALAQQSAPLESRIKGVEVVENAQRIARDGFVMAVSGKPPDGTRLIFVTRRGDRPKLEQFLEKWGQRGAAAENDAPSINKAGRILHRLGAHGVWWIEDGALVVTERRKAEAVLAVRDGKEPSALEHPLRVELAKTKLGSRAAAVAFLDMAPFSPLPPSALGLGLDGLKRIELRWGFDDDALSSVLRVVAPAPRRGVLALLDQPTFGINSLPPLPASTTSFAVLSIDPAKTYDQIDALMKQTDHKSPIGLANPRVLERAGLDLRKDLLAHLGTKLAFYAQAPDREDRETAAALLASRLSGFSFSAEVRDEAHVARVIDRLLMAFNPAMRQRQRVDPQSALFQFAVALNVRKVGKSPATYVIEWPPNRVLAPFSTILRPTVMVDRDQAVFAGSTAAAARALADGPRWQPDGASLPLARRVPAEMIYLSVLDPRVATPVLSMALPILVRQINTEIALAQRRAGQVPNEVSLRLDPGMVPAPEELNRLLFPSETTLAVDDQGAVLTHREAIPTICSPAVTGLLVALLLPAAGSAREAARRSQCVNNLKQVALAMHNYHATNNAFPRAAITDDNGKALLSWRVAILPYIGQRPLYNKFKLDEPWDSPHNKALLQEMPATYLCPSRSKGEPFATTYQVFVGQNALFEQDKDIGVQGVTDGTSNTIMVVEAKESVPWTKPADLTFDPAAAPSLFGAGSSHPGGFNACMGDGAVRFIKSTIDLNVFRALITRNLGEVFGAGAF
jgi:hypothetical protein